MDKDLIQQIAVPESRLAAGTWEGERQTGEGDIHASYSADVIAMENRIRAPFRYGSHLWACVSIRSGDDVRSQFEAYRLLPESMFLGSVTSCSAKVRVDGGDGSDALGGVLKDIGGAGQTTAYSYDANGNALTITDPLANVTQQSFDALNRLYQITDPYTNVTTLTYNAHDRPLTVTDANANVTTYIYKGFGNVIEQLSPDSGKTVYRYDTDGNLTSKTDASGSITNLTYDALDRPLTTTYPADASENVSYKYDEAGHGFGIGRLTSLTDAAGSLSRSYDERGNLLTDTRKSGSVTLKTVYSYDAASRIASITYPSGWTVSQTRDIMGRIWQLPLSAPSGVARGNAITNATYKPFGPLYTLSFGNGVNESRGFDLDYRVTGLTDSGAKPDTGSHIHLR